ncbi:MAG: NUDIX domain-containing protein [Coriobacteriia bacterium]
MTGHRHPRPALTADVVALSRIDGVPHVLLIRRGNEPFAGQWALPGGFVDEWERPMDAARRELAEETGLRHEGVLELVGVYGEPGRDPRGWTVSVVYRALLEAVREVAGADDAAEARWFPLDALPPLAFDHGSVVADAVSGGIAHPA